MRIHLAVIAVVTTITDASASNTLEQLQIANELGQAIAIADECDLDLDNKKVANVVGTIILDLDAGPRAGYDAAAYSIKRRWPSLSSTERAAMCGLAKGAAIKFDLLP